jgi:hypothetical protein
VELMNNNAEKMSQSRSIHSPQRCGWLLGIMSILLLFCVQPLLSAKTLLEQYLNCDGFEEFAFYLEYPGQTDQFPSTYWCGTYQDGNFLLIRSGEPVASIPDSLPSEVPLFTTTHFDRTWWIIDTSSSVYERKVWEDQGIPEEENNNVKIQCIHSVNTLYGNLLNFGLFHSGINMHLDNGSYTNSETHIFVEYEITEKNEDGLPTTILAKSINLEGLNTPVTWKRKIEYSSNEEGKKIPCEIISSTIYDDGVEKVKSRIVIDKLIPATGVLPREHFLRSAYTDTRGFTNYGAPTTYYVRSNLMVGVDSKSNEVIRMEPDDPRLLNAPDQKKIIFWYWISAIAISVFSISFIFIYKKR